jgi:hypothetical protein
MAPITYAALTLVVVAGLVALYLRAFRAKRRRAGYLADQPGPPPGPWWNEGRHPLLHTPTPGPGDRVPSHLKDVVETGK